MSFLKDGIFSRIRPNSEAATFYHKIYTPWDASIQEVIFRAALQPILKVPRAGGNQERDAIHAGRRFLAHKAINQGYY